MSTSTWLMLQLFVAGCAGLLMLLLMRTASRLWERFANRKRVPTETTVGVRLKRRALW